MFESKADRWYRLSEYSRFVFNANAMRRAAYRSSAANRIHERLLAGRADKLEIIEGCPTKSSPYGTGVYG